ncbi:hypothetical protein [Humibacillus xanthopallidus]|uniref:hypothetical protein n=1 Tax=Humibacillus xanthopallidus TaxID=412689 RepID=UPI0038501A18
MDEPLVLDAWFIHPKLALSLLDDAAAREVASRLPAENNPMWRSFHMDLMERALAQAFAELKPVSLAVAHAEQTLDAGQLVWVEQRFYFKGVGKALDSLAAGRVARASFTAPLATDSTVSVTGSYNVRHLTSETSAGELSGAKRQFVVGYVTALSPQEVDIRPILIANRWGRGVIYRGLGFVETEPLHVWPGAVDQFAGVDWGMRLGRPDLDRLRDVTEEQLKIWLAGIIGEPEVPKDWGGEQFDLWSDRMTVNGKRLRAAFLLKGPAKFHPMTISDLGKNGDQISRLAHTAADLLVVQHCHAITAPVQHMLHAFAADPANPRRYMTIDGYNTIRILKHFRHLG